MCFGAREEAQTHSNSSPELKPQDPEGPATQVYGQKPTDHLAGAMTDASLQGNIEIKMVIKTRSTVSAKPPIQQNTISAANTSTGNPHEAISVARPCQKPALI